MLFMYQVKNHKTELYEPEGHTSRFRVCTSRSYMNNVMIDVCLAFVKFAETQDSCNKCFSDTRSSHKLQHSCKLKLHGR